jgi:hypothetical protein
MTTEAHGSRRRKQGTKRRGSSVPPATVVAKRATSNGGVESEEDSEEGEDVWSGDESSESGGEFPCDGESEMESDAEEETAVSGSNASAQVRRKRREKGAALLTLGGSPAFKTMKAAVLLEALRGYHVIDVMLNIRFGGDPAAAFKAALANELSTPLPAAETMHEICATMRGIINTWQDALIRGHPSFGMQTYAHLLLHAPDLCLRSGGVGLYSSCGIESLHQTVKHDLARHRSGRKKFADLPKSLLLRALWRSDEKLRGKVVEILSASRD